MLIVVVADHSLSYGASLGLGLGLALGLLALVLILCIGFCWWRRMMCFSGIWSIWLRRNSVQTFFKNSRGFWTPTDFPMSKHWIGHRFYRVLLIFKLFQYERFQLSRAEWQKRGNCAEETQWNDRFPHNWWLSIEFPILKIGANWVVVSRYHGWPIDD